MIVLKIIKILALGVAAEIAIVVLLGIFIEDPIQTIFEPWFWAGEWLLPSTGPGSHAMALGGLLGAALGVLVQAALLGLAVDRLITWRISRWKPTA